MIRLGVNVPNFGPGTTPASLRSWVTLAEEAGFSSWWMAQLGSPDALTVLGPVGRATSTIELGTAVVLQDPAEPLRQQSRGTDQLVERVLRRQRAR